MRSCIVVQDDDIALVLVGHSESRFIRWGISNVDTAVVLEKGENYRIIYPSLAQASPPEVLTQMGVHLCHSRVYKYLIKNLL